MKIIKISLLFLLCALLLAGCAPAAPNAPQSKDGFVVLEGELLTDDPQLNSLLSAFNCVDSSGAQITKEMISPGKEKQQVLVHFPTPAVTVRLTINESGLFLAFDGDASPEELRPLFFRFCQAMQPDIEQVHLEDLWTKLQSGTYPTFDTLQHGDLSFVSLTNENGARILKIHHSGKDYLGQELRFAVSCRRRKNSLVPPS